MSGVDASGVSPPARTGSHRLADGRRLGWAEWGPRDAPALLLCSGAATGRRLGFASTDVLERAGVRLLALDRPGVGTSDPQPSRSLADWPADVAELRDGRALELRGAVGFSQGAPFALALGRAGVVPAVAVVSGTDELAFPSLRERLSPEVAALVDAVAADPAAVEAHLADVVDAEGMQELVLQMSASVDVEVYTQPAFAAAYSEALRDGLRPGAAGYARDVVLTMSPWPFAAEDVRAPVDLWYGQLDASPVHSPDLGLTLSRRLVDGRRHVVPDAGAAILWSHAERICRGLLDRTAAAAAPPTPLVADGRRTP